MQWYGEQRELSDAFPFSLIASFRVKDRKSLAEISTYLEMCRSFGNLPSAILVDAYVEGAMGGTGHKAPWDLLADFKPGVPLILAGGLTPENVGDAIRIVRPAGVDVASGVETSPGRKDPHKVKAFIASAREAACGIERFLLTRQIETTLGRMVRKGAIHDGQHVKADYDTSRDGLELQLHEVFRVKDENPVD